MTSYGGSCGNYRVTVAAVATVVLPWLLWQIWSYGDCAVTRKAKVTAVASIEQPTVTALLPVVLP